MAFKKISIEATVAADVQTVWEVWTKPEHITKWNAAAESWHCPSARNDLRVGGEYWARMEAKDGSFGFDFVAVYDEVKTLDRMTYTLGDGRKVMTSFVERDGKTTIATVFDAEQENPEDLQRAGWRAILDNFKKYVESL